MEIEGDFDTLADKNIFPGDVLWVTDTEIHENRDIVGKENKNASRLFTRFAQNISFHLSFAIISDLFFQKKMFIDELSEQKTNANQAEEGFRGTLLTADVAALIFRDASSG